MRQGARQCWHMWAITHQFGFLKKESSSMYKTMAVMGSLWSKCFARAPGHSITECTLRHVDHVVRHHLQRCIWNIAKDAIVHCIAPQHVKKKIGWHLIVQNVGRWTFTMSKHSQCQCTMAMAVKVSMSARWLDLAGLGLAFWSKCPQQFFRSDCLVWKCWKDFSWLLLLAVKKTCSSAVW